MSDSDVERSMPLTYKWLVTILFVVLLGTVGTLWSLQASYGSTERAHLDRRVAVSEERQEENARGLARNTSEMAIVKADLGHIQKTIDEIKKDVKLLLQRQGL